MPRVFLGNFDFEHELARPAIRTGGSGTDDSATAGQLMRAQSRSELFWAWLPIAEAEDFLIAPRPVDPRAFAGLAELGITVPKFVDPTSDLRELRGAELLPWGWTAAVVAFGRANGCTCPAPPLPVVREVNSRAFRVGLERESKAGLAGAALITSIDALEAVLLQQGNAPRGWLLKANFGMSGREALHGRGVVLDDQTRNWARKRLATIGPVIFEPMVERVAEAGIQIDIPRTGSPQLAGVTPLLVDRSGVYRGSRFGCPAGELDPWQPAVESGMRVAATVQRLGYFGPLGIDAMRYRDEAGAIRLRPLQDLNARYTMGRLALGFGRLLPFGWCGTWLHFGRRHLAGRDIGLWLDGIRRSLNAEATVAVTSPRTIDSQPVEHHAVLVAAPSPHSRRHAEGVIFESLGIAIDAG